MVIRGRPAPVREFRSRGDDPSRPTRIWRPSHDWRSVKVAIDFKVCQRVRARAGIEGHDDPFIIFVIEGNPACAVSAGVLASCEVQRLGDEWDVVRAGGKADLEGVIFLA